MSENSILTEESKSFVGREAEPLVGYPVSEHEIRRFCYAVDDLNPRYVGSKGADDEIIAPPLFISIPFDRDVPLAELSEDGIPEVPKGALMPPLKAERRMWGGVEMEFFAEVRPGDVLTAQTRILDVYERQGRSGPLAFVVNETRYTDQSGKLVAVERNTVIAR